MAASLIDCILLIDDSEPDLLFTRIVLERAAIAREIAGFDSAREALDWLLTPAGAGVDLILLDINMPGMDGFEFLAAYQAARPGPRAPAVVMLSSSPDPTDRRRAASFECVCGYITKPVDTDAALALPAMRGR